MGGRSFVITCGVIGTLYCTVAMCLSAKAVARSSRPTTASTDPRNYFISSLTTGRAFATSPCGGRRGGGKGRVCPAPGRGQISSAILVGNIYSFFIHKIVKCIFLGFILIVFLRLYVMFVEVNLS